MISAVVVASDHGASDQRAREIIVRSLVWLVSAVVAGVVRDVTLAVPPGLDLGEVADQAGCRLVEAAGEAARLARAMGDARCDRILVLEAGFQPIGPLVDVIDRFEQHARPGSAGLLIAEPLGLLQRLFPDRGRTVGALVPRSLVTGTPPQGLRALFRTARAGTRLRTRMQPIV